MGNSVVFSVSSIGLRVLGFEHPLLVSFRLYKPPSPKPKRDNMAGFYTEKLGAFPTKLNKSLLPVSPSKELKHNGRGSDGVNMFRKFHLFDFPKNKVSIHNYN